MIYSLRFFVALSLASSGAAIPFGPNLEVATIVGSDVPGFQDGIGTSATLALPKGIRRKGNYYLVADNHMIRQIDAITFEVTTLAGQASTGFNDDDGTSALFFSPMSIVSHPTENYALIGDFNNNRIRKMTLTSPYTVTTLAGSTLGYAEGTAAKFHNPYFVDISPDGNYAVVSDTGNSMLRVIDLNTDPVEVSPLASTLLYPNDIRFFNSGNALLAAEYNNPRVLHVTFPAGNRIFYCPFAYVNINSI